MLTNRQSKILKLIINEYIKLAKPVGSKLICNSLKCSSATVRSEMATLEELGLLEKTHTSSGRIPSEKGYRYYVDHLMEPKKMSGEDILNLQIVFNNSKLELSDSISKSLQIIADLTNYTTIALGKASHDNILKQISIVPLNENQLVAIVITDKGYVEHKNISLDGVSLTEIEKTVSIINNIIIGTPIDEVAKKLEFEVKPIIAKYVSQHERIYQAFYDVFKDFSNQNINIVGKNNLLKQPEFNSVDKIRDIFSKFDDRNIIDNIEEKENDINIYIGNENNFDKDTTIIKTKYTTPYEEGTIAIVGPKRMEYDKVVALLEYIKEQIGSE